MKFNFKKITAVAATFLVAGLTLGTASAANYSAFKNDNGSVNAAIVYGSDADELDQAAASSIQDDMDLPSTIQTSTGGESVELHRDNSRLYLGDNLNEEQSSFLDSDDLPGVLAEETFSGAESGGSSTGVDYDQEVTIGSDPSLTYEQQPTDDEDPVVGWNMSEDADSSSNYVMEYTVDFDDSANFTDLESIGETIEMQGTEYAITADTSVSELYLTESAEEIALAYGPESTNNPADRDIEIDGDTYNVELTSGSETDVRVTVTGPNGNTESESIDEDNTKDVGDLTVTPTYTSSDEVGEKVSATLVVSGEEGQIRLANNDSVQVGTDENTVDGTYVQFNGGGSNDVLNSTDSISVFSSGEDDDTDAITMDSPYEDPAFGNLNVVLEEFSSPTSMDSEDRETITVENSDDETASIDFTSYEGNGQSMEFYEDPDTDGVGYLANDNETIHVVENETVAVDEYVVLSNEEQGTGAILELKDIDEDQSSSKDDVVTFRNVLTDNEFDADINDGTANDAEINEFNSVYSVSYNESTGSDGTANISFDKTSGSDRVVFPTIETSEGARLAFTEPVNVTVGSGDLLFPEGDEGYSRYSGDGGKNGGNDTHPVRSWEYTISNVTGTNDTLQVELNASSFGNSGTLNQSAVHLIEEENDQDTWGSVIAQMGTSDNEVEVADTYFTTDEYTSSDITHESNDDMSSMIDFWGTKVMTDSSGDQDSVEISYPDNQLYADTSLASETTTEEASGEIMYTDTEVMADSDLQEMNLVAVGGSAVNKVTAEILGLEYPAYGEKFTEETGVGTGEYMVRGYENPWDNEKVAIVVAGYATSDTQDAASYVTNNDIELNADLEKTGPSVSG